MPPVTLSVNEGLPYPLRMATLAERKRQVVVDELTEAALQLLAIKGFDTTTVDEIVAAAGVSRRTFFRYFASKEDVVVQNHFLRQVELLLICGLCLMIGEQIA